MKLVNYTGLAVSVWWKGFKDPVVIPTANRSVACSVEPEGEILTVPMGEREVQVISLKKSEIVGDMPPEETGTLYIVPQDVAMSCKDRRDFVFPVQMGGPGSEHPGAYKYLASFHQNLNREIKLEERGFDVAREEVDMPEPAPEHVPEPETTYTEPGYKGKKRKKGQYGTLKDLDKF